MKIGDITATIEALAPRVYQESYDNSGLLTGNKNWKCTSALLTLDCTEAVIEEAVELGCNLVIAHHPIIFKGLKSITGKTYVERTIIAAIKNDVAIYAAHTNLDNVFGGVNTKIAEKLDLKDCAVLAPKSDLLFKLITFAPESAANAVRNALFEAGAGHIGQYSNCSFNSEGIGTFKGGATSKPTIGQPLEDQEAKEVKIEVLLPKHITHQVLSALGVAHPYEEVAYDLIPLSNAHQHIGSGMIGTLESPMKTTEFLAQLKVSMNTDLIRHTALVKNTIEKVAVCGGVGSFLLPAAKAKGADIYVSSDFKYHEFFDAEEALIIADIGHFESEQFTPEIFASLITQKFPNFALHFSKVNTNPIKYL